MSATRAALIGAGGAVGAKALLLRGMRWKLDRDVAALNAGDPAPLLSVYADDAVLRFNDGDHRWAGEHRGKGAIERFLRNFIAAGITGDIRELHVSGPPWAMKILVRFDDRSDLSGERIYENRTVLVIRARWGRIVEHEDFYEDTGRIAALEARLRELGVAPV
jgi:ketosteroid isomerase-like protein